jgi:2-polyprenyl-3-methyl-5-hydroxy-6-metoxy-1,4-benzoquinol methylase
MDAYTGFAAVYELFMDNIPYEEWARYIQKILQEHGIENGLMLELGCGTGSLTRIMSAKGYDMIGIDNAAEMLAVALEQEREKPKNILYLLQDMCEFELYGTVKAVISICDCINYVTEPKDLLQVFCLVNNYLDTKGIFIFDMNTLYKYKEILGATTIAENREEGSFIWENFYDEEERINEYDLSIFIPEGELYRKYEEVHYQRAYTIEEILELIEQSGLKLLNVYDAFTFEKPKVDSERVYFVVQENGK